MKLDFDQRANDIATFFDVPVENVEARLSLGFHANHAEVAEDFRVSQAKVDNPDSLLNWYKTTSAYIWELSAYHLEEGFNYMGMCEGLSTHLTNKYGPCKVMSLGDGVGDLVGKLVEDGHTATYHDLASSLTSSFAFHQLGRRGLEFERALTIGWDPVWNVEPQDAVIALDFFEHLVNVEDWARAVFDTLDHGGIFCAQNAFSIGDAEHGDSIPMHLSINNKYTEEWAPLMKEIGFEDDPSGWWVKP